MRYDGWTNVVSRHIACVAGCLIAMALPSISMLFAPGAHAAEPDPASGLYVGSAYAQVGNEGNPVKGIDTDPVLSAFYTDPDNDPRSALIIQVATQEDFTSGIVWDFETTQGGPNRSRTPDFMCPSLNANTRYWWRVKFQDITGAWGKFSDVNAAASFVTDAGPNSEPAAPTQLFADAADAQLGSAGNPVVGVGTMPVFSAIYNDSNSGDTAIGYRLQFASDSNFNSILMDSSDWPLSAAVSVGTRSENLASPAPLNPGTTYYWRVLFWDAAGYSGAWSTEMASFTTDAAPANTRPALATALKVGSSNQSGPVAGDPVPNVDPNTLYFCATFNDPDAGDSAAAANILLATDLAFDVNSLVWDSALSSPLVVSPPVTPGGQSARIAYTGPQLANGTPYFWRIQFRDTAGEWGDFSTLAASFTTAPAPPVNIAPTAATGLMAGSANQSGPAAGNPVPDIDPVTLYFNAIFNDPDMGDASGYVEIHIALDAAFGTVVWSSVLHGGTGTIAPVIAGQRCQNIAYTGQALAAATTYHWRIAFQDAGGEWGQPSTELASFTTSSALGGNQPPVAPASLVVGSTEARIGSGGAAVDLTPVFSAIFQDPDTADAALAVQVQVSSDPAFATTIWDSGFTSLAAALFVNSRCPDIAYAGTALQNSTVYRWRIRFRDGLGADGAWNTGTFATVAAATNETAPLPAPSLAGGGGLCSLAPARNGAGGPCTLAGAALLLALAATGRRRRNRNL